MTACTNLDQLIRRLPGDRQAPSPTANVESYLLDPRSNKVVRESTGFKATLKGLIGGSRWRYIVTIGEAIDYTARPIKVPLRNISRDSIEIGVRCRLTCSKAGQALVEALGGETSPSEAFDLLLEDRIQDYAWQIEERKEDIIGTLLQEGARWEAHLSREIAQSTGLSVSVSIEVKEQPKPISIDQDTIEVTLKNSVDRISIAYEIELKVDNPRNAIAGLTDVMTFKHSIRDAVAHEFEECTLHDAAFRKAKVEQDLAEVIRAKVSPHGYRVAFFKLADPVLPFPIPAMGETSLEQRSPYRDSQRDRIQVLHELLTELESLDVWRQSGVPNPQQWIRDRLEDITKKALFSRDYAKIVLEFKNPAPADSNGPPLADSQYIEDLIRAQLSREAITIGCRVVQHSSVLDTGPIKLLSRLPLDPIKDTFSPKDGLEPVEIEIAVDGRLKDLDKVKDQIKPGHDLVNEIREFIINNVRAFMHGVSLEEFYLGVKAEATDDSLGDSFGLTVDERLGKKLREELLEKYNATCDVVIKQKPSRITDRWRTLSAKTPIFEVEVSSSDGDRITYKVGYIVRGIAMRGWPAFMEGMNGRPDVEDEIRAVTALIENTITDRLDRSFRRNELAPRTSQGKQQLRVAIESDNEKLGPGVLARVGSVHGLDIEISPFTCVRTLFDDAQEEVARRRLKARVDQEIRDISQAEKELEKWNEQALKLIDNAHERIFDQEELEDARDKARGRLKEIDGLGLDMPTFPALESSGDPGNAGLRLEDLSSRGESPDEPSPPKAEETGEGEETIDVEAL